MDTIQLPTVDGWLAVIVVFFVLLDIATGITKAIKEGTFSSSGLREGGAHKASYFALIALGWGLDWGMMHADLGVTLPAYASICAFVIAIEIVSIVENIVAVNPNIDFTTIYKILGITKKEDE